ncbi:MAG: SGNH/GDSL hydrolase family protein [Muribaculum sp.]|nr:SGNH/GDSL hydrolase family protein [Muribaculum sp.]
MKINLISLMTVAAMFATAASEAFGADTKKVDYIDAADSLTVINKAQPGGEPLKRIEVDKYPGLTDKVREYYGMSTGIAVLFRTDSPNIYAKWTTDDNSKGVNTTVIAQKGLDLYIRDDGKWIFAGYGKPKYVGKEHKSTIVANMDSSMKECMLYLPVYDCVHNLEIGVDSGAVIEPIPNPFDKKIVVMGSSITHGSGISRPGMAYPARLQRIFGVEAANLGASGQCKLEDFFADVAADSEADAFIFDTFSNPSAEQIDERLEPFVKKIRAAHPTTPLIFLQTEIRESGNFDTTKRKFESEKREAASRGMKKIMDTYDNVYFINPGMPLGTDHEATVDGVHPTDLGLDRVVSHIAPIIKEILVNSGVISQ